MLAMLVFIVLHGPDGREVIVSTDAITSIHCKLKDDDGDNKLFVDGANAIISLSDGKRLAVTETCEEVQRQAKESNR